MAFPEVKNNLTPVPVPVNGASKPDNVVVVESTDRPGSDGLPLLPETGGGLGSGLAYVLAGVGIKLFTKDYSIAGAFANRASQFSGNISTSRGANMGKFVSESIYHAGFLLVIRSAFEGTRMVEMGDKERGDMTQFERIPWYAGKSVGLHSLGSIPAAAAGFGVYGMAQAAAQSYLQNNVRAYLIYPNRVLSGQIESQFIRRMVGGYLGAGNNITPAGVALNLAAMSLGTYAGWFAADYTMASLDSERIDLYNETPGVIVERYTDGSFPGVLVGWTVGGHLGFGTGMATYHLAIEFIDNKFVVSPIFMSMLTPDGQVSEGVMKDIVSKARRLQEVAEKLNQEIAAGKMSRPADLEAMVRGRFLDVLMEHPSAVPGRDEMVFMRNDVPKLEANVARAAERVRDLHARLETALKMSDGYKAVWDAAQTAEERERVMASMYSSAERLGAEVASAKRDLDVAIRELELANNLRVNDAANGSVYYTEAIGTSGKMNPDGTPERMSRFIDEPNTRILRELRTKLDDVSAKIEAAMKSSQPSTLGSVMDRAEEFLSDVAGAERAAESARLDRFTRIDTALGASRAAVSEAMGYFDGISFVEDRGNRHFGELMTGPSINPAVHEALSKYNEGVAKLKDRLVDVRGTSEVTKGDRVARVEGAANAYGEFKDAYVEAGKLKVKTKAGFNEISNLQQQASAYKDQADQLATRDGVKNAQQIKYLHGLKDKVNVKIGEVAKKYGFESIDGRYQHRGLNAAYERVAALVDRMKKDGLSVDKAAAFERELTDVRRKFVGVKEDVGELVNRLDEAEKIAKANGSSDAELLRISTLREHWSKVKANLDMIPETSPTMFDKVLGVMEKAGIAELRPTQSLRALARKTARTTLDTVGNAGGGVGKKVLDYTLMVGLNVLFGTELGYLGEKAVRWMVQDTPSESLPKDKGYGPDFLFDLNPVSDGGAK